MNVAEPDFVPMGQFPLQFRWTDTRYHQFPAHELAPIKPLSAPKAKEVWATCQPFTHDDSLAPELFESIIQFEARDVDDRDVSRWLSDLNIRSETPVLLSWAEDLAVLLPFDLFCGNWSDFHYPSSDDLVVFPCSEEWAVFLHHEEVIFYGRRRP